MTARKSRGKTSSPTLQSIRPLSLLQTPATSSPSIIPLGKFTRWNAPLPRSLRIASHANSVRRGLFSSVAEHRPAPGVISYTVNAPGWTDGAHADRFIALPDTSQITFVEEDRDAHTWGFADGSVAVQTLSLDLEAGNTISRRRIETRILVKQEDHWLGYSYLWNDEQTDAALVDAAGADLIFNLSPICAGRILGRRFFTSRRESRFRRHWHAALARPRPQRMHGVSTRAHRASCSASTRAR